MKKIAIWKNNIKVISSLFFLNPLKVMTNLMHVRVAYFLLVMYMFCLITFFKLWKTLIMWPSGHIWKVDMCEVFFRRNLKDFIHFFSVVDSVSNLIDFFGEEEESNESGKLGFLSLLKNVNILAFFFILKSVWFH